MVIVGTQAIRITIAKSCNKRAKQIRNLARPLISQHLGSPAADFPARAR
jgi:hypothetical protein